jgi:hypothetical protein
MDSDSLPATANAAVSGERNRGKTLRNALVAASLVPLSSFAFGTQFFRSCYSSFFFGVGCQTCLDTAFRSCTGFAQQIYNDKLKSIQSQYTQCMIAAHTNTAAAAQCAYSRAGSTNRANSWLRYAKESCLREFDNSIYRCPI